MKETATCIDCGLDVTYNDEGFWPWRGIDGSDTCTAARSPLFNCHRTTRNDAEDIFAAFTVRTKRRARHA